MSRRMLVLLFAALLGGCEAGEYTRYNAGGGGLRGIGSGDGDGGTGGAPTGNINEEEENDSAASAQELGSPGQVSGDIGSDHPGTSELDYLDVYSFVPESSGTYTFTLDDFTNADLILEIVDVSDPSNPIFVSGVPVDAPIATTQDLSSGTEYMIYVIFDYTAPSNSPTSYTLSID